MSAGYRLTNTALEDIAHIHGYSTERWGERKADDYITALYHAFGTLAAVPDRNGPRHVRSAPFWMAAVERHFIIYAVGASGIVVLTILHQAQDIETRIARLTPAFLKMVAKLSNEH